MGTISLTPIIDLTVKDFSDLSDLTFRLNGIINLVTGCPVLSIRLLSAPSMVGT